MILWHIFYVLTSFWLILKWYTFMPLSSFFSPHNTLFVNIRVTIYFATCYIQNTGLRSDQISRSVVSNSLRPHELRQTRPPCPSPTPGSHSDSRPSSQWCHPAISSSVVPFSSCPQSLPASGSFPMNQLFACLTQVEFTHLWIAFYVIQLRGLLLSKVVETDNLPVLIFI